MSPEEIVAEFSRKYNKTFVFVQMPDSNEENLFYLYDVKATKNNIGTMGLQSDELGKINLNISTEHTIKFKYPKVGVFQHGTDAYLVTRDPQRQWRRGLCRANCFITAIHRLYTAGRLSDEAFDFPLVSSAFAQETFSYKDALMMLNKGKYRSVALADGYSLMLSPTKEGSYILFYWLNPIAKVKTTGEVSIVLEEAFTPQIKAICT